MSSAAVPAADMGSPSLAVVAPADEPRRHRAPNGTGTLFWDPRRERYHAKVTVKGGARSTKYFSVTAYGDKRRAEQAAKEWLEEQKVDGRRGVKGPPKNPLLATAVQEYLDCFTGRTAEYKSQIRTRLTKLVTRFPGSRVQALGSTIYAFFGELDCSPKEYRHIRYAIREFVDFCQWREWAPERWANWKLIKNPKLQPRRYHLFIDGTGARLVDERPALLLAARVAVADRGRHLPGERQEAVFSLQAYEALSPGEALGLAWLDVAPDCSFVRVDRTVQAVRRLLERFGGDWGRVLKEFESGRTAAKRGARIRTIYLSEESQRAMLAWRKVAPADAILVFPAAGGGPEASQHLDDLCVRLCTAAGISRHNPGDLRHTAITIALAFANETAGVSYANVSRWAGHERVSTTTDCYLHMLPRAQGSIQAWGSHQKASLDSAEDGF